MTTEIVVATRSGLVSGPDGTKYRLVRGKTLADARHPVATQFPELFGEYAIDLPYEGDEVPAAGADPELAAEAEGMREQLVRLRDGLVERGVVDADSLPTHVGWLADAVFEALDRELNPVAPPTPPRRGPGRPRKQQD